MSNSKLNFPIFFTLKEIKEAKKDIPDINSSFKFYYDKEEFDIDILSSILISEKVKEEIVKDSTKREYKLVKNNYNLDLLNNFFNSIEEGTVSIEFNDIISFSLLCDELKISRLTPLIENSILTYFCSKISQDISQIKTIEEKYQFIGSNIKDIDIEQLKNVPYSILYNMLTNAVFNNENEKANFFISIDFIGIDFISKIKFEDLSLNTLEKVILRIENDEDKSELIDNFISRCKKEINERKEIKLVNITVEYHPDKNLNLKTIDFSFLEKLNSENDKYLIKVKTYYENQIIDEIEKDEDYLIKNCDILVFGGLDGFPAVIGKFSDRVYTKIKEFNDKGGFLLLIHDVLGEKTKCYHDLLGICSIKNVGNYDRIEFNRESEKYDILQIPFEFKNHEIPIATNHNWPVTGNNAKPSIFNFSGTENRYYFEDINKNIAFCNIGHLKEIKEDEQKLFYNIVCHEYVYHQILKRIK